jgi:hypothetical protein
MAHEREIIRVGQIEIRFLLEGTETNGQLAMFEFTIPARAKVPLPHSHERYDVWVSLFSFTNKLLERNAGGVFP